MSSKKLTLLALAALMGLSQTAFADETQDQETGTDSSQVHEQKPMGSGKPWMSMKADRDNDGKISAEEAQNAEQKWKEIRKAKVDTNKDGVVDETEKSQMREKMQGRREERQEMREERREERQEMREERRENKEAWQEKKEEWRENHPRMDKDNNPPGMAGGPGTNWENKPGPQGGPGASPNRGGNPPGPKGGPGAGGHRNK